MNIYEAYEEAKKGKFVRAKGCDSVFFALKAPYLTESRSPVILKTSQEPLTIQNKFSRPTALSLGWISTVDSLEGLSDFSREFESFTEEELLKRIQEEFDEREKLNSFTPSSDSFLFFEGSVKDNSPAVEM